VRTDEWDRETFRRVLEDIQDRTHLTEAELAALAGRSRSQVNRWTRAENQPAYDPLRRLVDGLQRFAPEVRKLGIELLEAAGYAPPEPLSPVSPVVLTVAEETSAGVRIEEVGDSHLQVGLTIETDVTMDQMYERLGDLSPNERAMIANMEAMDFPASEIGGAVLMLRGFDARRTGQQGSRPRRRA
jgi:hypothetical protein